MVTPPCSFYICFTTGNIFVASCFTSLERKAVQKGGLHLKEGICSLKSKVFLLRVDKKEFSKKKTLTEWLPLKVYQYTLKCNYHFDKATSSREANRKYLCEQPSIICSLVVTKRQMHCTYVSFRLLKISRKSLGRGWGRIL